MKKSLPPLFVCLFFAYPGFSQNYFHFSQFTQSAHAINPAFSGIEDFIDLKTGYRKQWSKINGSPTTFFIGVSASDKSFQPDYSKGKSFRVSNPGIFKKYQYRRANPSKHGFGLYLLNNSQGPFSTNAAYLSYAYHHGMSNGLMFAMGASANIDITTFDEFDAMVFNPGMDVTYQTYAAGRRTGTSIGANGGFALYNEQFYVSYAIHNLFLADMATESLEENQALYHFVMAGMNLEFSSEFSFQPTVLLKYSDFHPLSLDVNARMKYRQLGWVGLSYRNNNDIVGMLGLLIDQKINLSYSFDFSNSDLGRNNSGTHEVVLSFRLGGGDEMASLLW